MYYYADPSALLYTQDSIKPYFQDGRCVHCTITQINLGKLSVDALPPVHVVSVGGGLFSTDNRRLYVLKETCCAGDQIRVKVGTRCRVEKLTTTSNGKTIILRHAPRCQVCRGKHVCKKDMQQKQNMQQKLQEMQRQRRATPQPAPVVQAPPPRTQAPRPEFYDLERPYEPSPPEPEPKGLFARLWSNICRFASALGTCFR